MSDNRGASCAYIFSKMAGAENSESPYASPQLSACAAVELGSAQAASTLMNEVWELVSYQVELLSGKWLYAILAVLLSWLIFIYCRKARVKVTRAQQPASEMGRVRKRDRVFRAGQDLVRRIGDLSADLGPLGRHGLRRPNFRRRASHLRPFQLHRFFSSKAEEGPNQLPTFEPPDALLEADLMESESQLPPEVLYLLKSVRVFGHFEKPLFMELCKNVETKFLPAGALLFRPGQPDDSVYVVQSGRLSVFMFDMDGSELPLKEVGTGENVHSLLCILDTLIDRPRKFTAVAAKALRDTYVLQVKASTYKSFLMENPDSLLRMIQVIMVRLQRVTFLALSKVLGLSSELFCQKMRMSNLDILELKCNQRTEPVSKPSSGATAPPPRDIESDEDYIEAEDHPFPQPSRSTSRPKKRRVRWHGSEEDTSDTDGDPVSRIYVPNTQPDFDVVIDQARVDRARFMIESDSDTSPSLTRKSCGGVYQYFTEAESSEVIRAATNDLVKIFRLTDDSLLKGRIQLLEIPANATLIAENSQDCCVYFIASGSVSVYRENTEGENVVLYCPIPGEFVGVLSALTGEPSFTSAKTTQHSHLIMISKPHLYQILSAAPTAICGLAFDLAQRLSPYLKHIDFALDWMVLEAGRSLYKQGTAAECAYIVLNGRLRSVVKKKDGKREMVQEHGRAETVGLLFMHHSLAGDDGIQFLRYASLSLLPMQIEMITKSPRANTVHAIRDTELAQLPMGLVETSKVKQPQVVAKLITMMGETILGSYSKLSSSTAGPDPNVKSCTSNLSTIAVVAVSPDVPLGHFTEQLCRAICGIDSALRLTSSLVQEKLGSKSLDGLSEYRLRTWLGHQEDTHRIVIYEADQTLTPWTQRCIRQADHILLVGLAENDPSVGKIVKQVEAITLRVQKELILLHRHDVKHPTNTRKWLSALGWLSSYFHVRCPAYIFSKHALQEEMAFSTTISRHSDFARLARKLTGTSIGLVLGGGGARGISQIGALRAFEEAGIPIDMVGGTSIGALIGALFCEEVDTDRTTERARKWAKRMGSWAERILDLTYPRVSMFTGRAFNNAIHDLFGEKQVEDLWLPYFCITTDITDSKMKIHRMGSLWHYVRASMSLSGYLPPLCDPVDGHLLLDGGYTNNLPADVMSNQGAQTIISVDVGAEDNNDLTNYGDHLSGWWLLWNSLNPFAKKVRVPNLGEVQSRLAYVSCMRQLELVKLGSHGEYIRPPIDKIGTLQFNKFEETLEIGYHHARTVVVGWMKSPSMQHLFKDPSSSPRAQKKAEGPAQEDHKLPLQLKKLSRDLATIASQIPNKPNANLSMLPKSLSSATLPVGVVLQDGSSEGIGGYWSSPEDDDLLTAALELTLRQQGSGDVSNESSPDEGPRTRQRMEQPRETVSDTTLD